MDWKTSGGIDVSYPLQLAAYARAWNKPNPDRRADNGGILRLAKDPAAKVHVEVGQFNGLEENYWPVFKAALTLHKYAKENS